jgi:hypothetical protein
MLANSVSMTLKSPNLIGIFLLDIFWWICFLHLQHKKLRSQYFTSAQWQGHRKNNFSENFLRVLIDWLCTVWFGVFSLTELHCSCNSIMFVFQWTFTTTCERETKRNKNEFCFPSVNGWRWKWIEDEKMVNPIQGLSERISADTSQTYSQTYWSFSTPKWKFVYEICVWFDTIWVKDKINLEKSMLDREIRDNLGWIRLQRHFCPYFIQMNLHLPISFKICLRKFLFEQSITMSGKDFL